MKTFTYSLLFLLIFTYSTFSLSNYDYVIQIEAEVERIDPERPWSKLPLAIFGGSGILINKRQILTAAHVIDEGTFFRVKIKGEWIACNLKKTFHEMDLALLELEEDALVEPFKGKYVDTQLGDEINVVGFPVNGSNITITRGIVSRKDYRAYAHSGHSFRIIQIDAPINSGNSGGPVFNPNGDLVGIAMQVSREGENQGYIIPAENVKYFFDDNAYPDLGIYCRQMLSDQLKNHFGVNKGILVVEIAETGSCFGILKDFDVILEVNSLVLNDEGEYLVDGIYYSLDYYIASKHIGDKLKIKFIRNKKELTATITLKKYAELLIPSRDKNIYNYFQYSGYIFVEVNLFYINSIFYNTTPSSLSSKYSEYSSKKLRRLVYVLNKIPHNINYGFDPNGFLLKKVNGVDVIDLEHAKKLLKKKDALLEFDLKTYTAIKWKDAKKATKEIDKEYGILDNYFWER